MGDDTKEHQHRNGYYKGGTGMVEASAGPLNKSGSVLDVPEAGQAIDPNQPGAQMTAFCVNCNDGSVTLPLNLDLEE